MKKCKYFYNDSGQKCCLREALVNNGDLKEAECPCKDFKEDKLEEEQE